MMILLGMLCILTGMWCLYLISAKQIGKSRQSTWHFFTRFPQCTRSLAYILFFIAAGIFIEIFGISIGFVSWWLFASPVVLLLILLINDLKNKNKVKMRKH